MAKISRSPYHGSRYVKRVVNRDFQARFAHSGDALFVDVPADGLTLSLNYTGEGSFHKIIIRESLGQLTITSADISGMIVYDLGGTNDTIESVVADSSTSITIPAGASDGSVIDVICDGQRWYVQAMIHGVTVTTY